VSLSSTLHIERLPESQSIHPGPSLRGKRKYVSCEKTTEDMRFMKKSKFLLGGLLVVSAVGYLMYTGIRETSTYYLTIEEFLPQREALANEGIRLAGRVQEGSVNWDPKTLQLSFVLGSIEKDSATAQPIGMPVHYQGLLPDMFAENRDVIVEGRSDGNVLTATTIMTSCPSKYEPELEAGA
jgi:cytochrome c-type biogenesis protein CcmE